MKKFYLGLVSLMLIMLHSCSQVGNAGGNINVYANYYLGRPTDVFSELAYVWTDMTLKDANGTATYDKNKAYKCQINMSYNNQ